MSTQAGEQKVATEDQQNNQQENQQENPKIDPKDQQKDPKTDPKKNKKTQKTSPKQRKTYQERQAHIQKAKSMTSPKIQKQIKIFSAILIVLLFIIAYNMGKGTIDLKFTVIGLLLGAIVGMILGRMYRVFWHTDDNEVVAQIDTLGIIMIIIYILIEVFRNQLFGPWVPSPFLSIFSLVFVAGTLYGRRLFMILSVHNVLKEQEKI